MRLKYKRKKEILILKMDEKNEKLSVQKMSKNKKINTAIEPNNKYSSFNAIELIGSEYLNINVSSRVKSSITSS